MSQRSDPAAGDKRWSFQSIAAARSLPHLTAALSFSRSQKARFITRLCHEKTFALALILQHVAVALHAAPDGGERAEDTGPVRTGLDFEVGQPAMGFGPERAEACGNTAACAAFAEQQAFVWALRPGLAYQCGMTTATRNGLAHCRIGHPLDVCLTTPSRHTFFRSELLLPSRRFYPQCFHIYCTSC